MKRSVILGIITVITAVVYIWGARQQGVLVNTNMHEIDQSAYLVYAKNLAHTQFQFIGDRNRMPLYPVLMSFFYEPGMSDDAFFERGKTVGIFLGLFGFLVTFVLLRLISNTTDAVAGTLVSTFTVFVYKAPYFQAEVLFYIISLTLFYLLLSLVNKPKVKTAVLAGLVGGLGHLTKASVLPAVLLAAFLLVFRVALDRRHSLYREETSAKVQKKPNGILHNLKCAVILLVCFILVILPYIYTSKKNFGRYFYNVNSTFYMWYDSWEQAELGTKAHGDRQGWPDMSPEEIPSFRKYMREHSLNDIFMRFKYGFREMLDRIINSYGYARFIMVYIFALALLFIQNMKISMSSIRHYAHTSTLLFISGYFLGYLFLYAWYSPIAAGNRFVLSLFLPLMLLNVWSISFAIKSQMAFSFFGRKVSASRVSVVVLVYLIAYLITVFPTRISTMFGGS